jgi:hypothetical protein
MLSFEFAASPAKLRDLVSNAGDSGRDALARCFELGYLVTAGYVFVTIGIGGVLTAVSRSGLGKFVILCGLAAAAFDLMESAALRQAIDRHPAGGSTAPLATAAAGLKFLALMAAVAAFCLWPFRTWFG